MTTTYQQETWSLAELFPSLDSPKIDQALDDFEKQIQAFEAYRSELSEDIELETFLKIIDHYDRANREFARIFGFAYLSFAGDTQDQTAQTMLGRMQQLAAEFDNRTMFFNLWWKALEDKIANGYLQEAGDNKYWLEALRLYKPFTLSEPEEKVVNLKDVNGAAALINLYSSITNRYTFQLEVDGEMLEMTRGELSVYVRNADPALRKAAYKELNRVYATDAAILGQIYQYRVRDWRSEKVGLRGHATPIAVRNLGNDIPDEVVDALLESCKKNAGIFHRFFSLKAKWLGMEKLRRYDVYAPVVETDKTYTYNEAIELIMESFQDFDPKFVEFSKKVLDEHHLDSEVRKGKRSGAFCAPFSPDLTPWVLTSYQGKPDDVATLAHELGHAIHALLSNHHSALTCDASLPLAEVASTFGEMLVVDKLLSQAPELEVRRDLLFRQMDNAYATIMRQAYFAMFEREGHDLIHSGASVDEISDRYLELLAEQFGDSIELSDDFRNEWVAIPHFYHTPFYVYAYAFGQLLVLSLYQQYRQEGDSFKPRYIDILAAGGSDAPIRVLEKAGIDVGTPDFWQGGFDVLEEALQELEALEIPN
jgi:oligoendopeptidase F